METLGLSPGDTAYISVPGNPGGIQVVVYASIDYFPTYNPNSYVGRNPVSLVVANLTYLQQFYADHQSSSMNTDAKLTKLDVTKNEKLVYFFASGNLLTDIDLSHNRYLQNLYLADNKLTGINLDSCK